MKLLASIATMLVLAEAGANTVFESESGFKITWPTRYKTD
jgi:hypothetical protein